MRWFGLGKAGPGPNPAFAKTWIKALVSLRFTEIIRMEFSQGVLDFFKRPDLRVADGVFWNTRPLGEGIFFPGACRLLGVGTV